MLPELVQRLGRAGYNASIMAIVLVFTELRHYLPNRDNILVDTKFTNIRQLVLVTNRQDVEIG